MNKIDELKTEVKKVIIGKDEVIDKVLMAILADGHILLEDIPGVGKQHWPWHSAVHWAYLTGVFSLLRIHCPVM